MNTTGHRYPILESQGYVTKLQAFSRLCRCLSQTASTGFGDVRYVVSSSECQGRLHSCIQPLMTDVLECCFTVFKSCTSRENS